MQFFRGSPVEPLPCAQHKKFIKDLSPDIELPVPSHLMKTIQSVSSGVVKTIRKEIRFDFFLPSKTLGRGAAAIVAERPVIEKKKKKRNGRDCVTPL